MITDIRDRLDVDPAIEASGISIGGHRLTLADPDGEGDCRLAFVMSLRFVQQWPGGDFGLHVYGEDGLLESTVFVQTLRTLREGEVQLEGSGYVKECAAVELLYTPASVW